MNPIAQFTPVELDCFYEVLGRMTFNIAGASKLARHKRPMRTVRDYCDLNPDDDKITRAAKEYLKDLAKMGTDELAFKWRGEDAGGEVSKMLDEDV